MYELPIIKGDIPSFANISQMLVRPKLTLPAVIVSLELQFAEAKIYRIVLNGDTKAMFQSIGHGLGFPHDTSHNLNAFVDLMADLSWLGQRHVIVVIVMADKTLSIDQSVIIDAISLAITHLNLERRLKLSAIILL
ncbi:MAG TPA: barstar family protein [Allosphingosinicella sp.]